MEKSILFGVHSSMHAAYFKQLTVIGSFYRLNKVWEHPNTATMLTWMLALHIASFIDSNDDIFENSIIDVGYSTFCLVFCWMVLSLLLPLCIPPVIHNFVPFSIEIFSIHNNSVCASQFNSFISCCANNYQTR